MDMNIIGGKDNKFTEAVTLSFHGCDVANFEQPFHKVTTSMLEVKILIVVLWFKGNPYLFMDDFLVCSPHPNP